jgi:hypothetical protein
VGWLDRRGHLRVPSLDIDRQIADLSPPVPPLPDVWRRASVIAVALVLMQRDGPVPPIHDLGFYAGITRTATVQALEALHSIGMIDDHDIPRRDALLLHLSARWWTRWFGLEARPEVAELDAEERIVLGVDDDLRRPGWALLDEEQDPDRGRCTTAAGPRPACPGVDAPSLRRRRSRCCRRSGRRRPQPGRRRGRRPAQPATPSPTPSPSSSAALAGPRCDLTAHWARWLEAVLERRSRGRSTSPTDLSEHRHPLRRGPRRAPSTEGPPGGSRVARAAP